MQNVRKCISRTYLHNVLDEEDFERFTKMGFFTGQRLPKFYSGIPMDQTIEQTLNRSLAFKGPFANDPSVTNVFNWILGTAAVQEIIDRIEQFYNVSFDRNYQHADAYDARVKLDSKHIDTVYKWFKDHNPFIQSNAIMSIYSGLAGDSTVINCLRC